MNAATVFKTEYIKKHPTLPARVTKITTPHGDILTPAFMPVATRAFMNLLTPDNLVSTHTQMILGGNTYHMLCAPGMEIMEAAGGMHAFMGWHHPMLTDSGGFQVFSLSKNGHICKIDATGGHFKHPVTGKTIHLTPESSIRTQKIIGADIIMAFDECTPEAGGREAALAALERTHRWLYESIAIHEKQPHSAYGFKQALFGIIQGGSFRDLREQSAAFILNAPLDGIAIGGEVIGFDMQKTIEVINWLEPMLPNNKARYTMGVGLNPQDLINVVSRGIDLFDCVAPTRNARHGTLYHGKAIPKDGWVIFESDIPEKKLLIKKAIFSKDNKPIMDGCECYTCQRFTRAYLHYLFKQQAMLYCQLACIHNIHIMQSVCIAMRTSILQQ